MLNHKFQHICRASIFQKKSCCWVLEISLFLKRNLKEGSPSIAMHINVIHPPRLLKIEFLQPRIVLLAYFTVELFCYCHVCCYYWSFQHHPPFWAECFSIGNLFHLVWVRLNPLHHGTRKICFLRSVTHAQPASTFCPSARWDGTWLTYSVNKLPRHRRMGRWRKRPCLPLNRQPLSVDLGLAGANFLPMEITGQRMTSTCRSEKQCATEKVSQLR